MPRKSEGREYLTITLLKDDYDTIKKLAAKRGCHMTDIGREYIQQGLNGQLTEDNIDFLAPLIREQLKSVLDPSMERMIALIAKTCVQSGAAAYLSADAILKFVPPSQRQDVEVSYDQARKKAVSYMRQKGDIKE